MAGWLFQATWVPQHLMAASLRGDGDAAGRRFAQRPTDAGAVARARRRRRFRKLDLGRRRHVRDGRPSSPRRPVMSPPSRRGAGFRRRDGDAACWLIVSSPRRSCSINFGAARRAAAAARSLSAITACSGFPAVHASPRARYPGLLAGPAADRVAGRLCRRRISLLALRSAMPPPESSPWQLCLSCRARVFVSLAFGHHAWRKQRSRAPRGHPRRDVLNRCRHRRRLACARRPARRPPPGRCCCSRCQTLRDIRSELARRSPGGKSLPQRPNCGRGTTPHGGLGARVANNPRFLARLTPWPVNISWALFANRGPALPAANWRCLRPAAAAAPRRSMTSSRAFSPAMGTATAPCARHGEAYGCEVVVVVPQDKAWTNDPFAASADYRLAEKRDGQWQIFVKAK